jgi:catechol 2,3-dioxygenase-like lactoylglutathione lyase family enzyme
MIDHIGVSVSDPARSRRFYEQALAFVLDPDGHNIEACCHMPP